MRNIEIFKDTQAQKRNRRCCLTGDHSQYYMDLMQHLACNLEVKRKEDMERNRTLRVIMLHSDALPYRIVPRPGTSMVGCREVLSVKDHAAVNATLTCSQRRYVLGRSGGVPAAHGMFRPMLHFGRYEPDSRLDRHYTLEGHRLLFISQYLSFN